MSPVIAIGPSSFAEKDDTPLRMLEAAGCIIKPNPFGRRLKESEIIAHLEGVDGLIAGLEPLNRSVLESAHPQLKALARVGIGVANVDFESARDFGVAVSSTPDGPIDAVAEMTLAALLTLARQLIPTNAALHRGEWAKSIGLGLRGAKVLLIGYGRIGRRVGDLLLAFGAEVRAYDVEMDPETLTRGVRFTDRATSLPWADIVSLHASGEACILDARAFELMKPGVLLLNGARGSLVDETALLAALDSGKVAGVWFDAFWEEPYAGPLTRYEQAILTPHVGTYTERCRLQMETEAVRNLLRDLGLPGVYTVIAAALDDWRNYFTGPTWTAAFEFLEQLPVDSPDGDGLASICGDELLYRVMSYPTRGPEGTTVEAHEKYVDIQMSLEGTEAIDWFELDGLKVHTPYDGEKDYVLYERPAQPTGTVINRPRYFSVFFPEDGHTAQKSADGVSETVRKVVIKVRLSCVRPL